MSEDRKRIAALKRRVSRARNFPQNTCPASRHAQMIGEAMVKGREWGVPEDDRVHCGESILATVAALYEARTELAKMAPTQEAQGSE